jgi:hypothetical protein
MTCKAACAAVQAGGGSITVPPGLKPGVFLALSAWLKPSPDTRHAGLGSCYPTLPQKKAEGWGTPALLAGQGWGTRRLFGTFGMAEAKP